MGVPYGLSVFDRSGSTWIHWWSPETSAKPSISSWVMTRGALGPISWPTIPFIPSMPWASTPVAASEGEQGDPLRAGLEATAERGRDPDRVELDDIDDLVVDFDPPGAGDH